MKILEQINNTTMKVAKGMIAIFTLKLALIVTVFIFQSCTKEANNDDHFDSLEFDNALDVSMININSINLNSNNGMLSRLDSGEDTVYLSKETLENSSDFENLDTFNNFNELLSFSYQNDLKLTKNIDTGDEIINSYTISEDVIRENLEPTLIEARNYLYSIGMVEADLIRELGSINDARVIETALVISKLDSNSNSDFSFNIPLSLFGNSAYALQSNEGFFDSQVGSCLLSALGITAIRTIINSTAALSTSAVLSSGLQILKHIGLRYLGYFGLAVAIYNFTECVSE